MTNIEARAWADLFVKMGFHYTKAEVTRFATGRDGKQVWSKYVLSNPVYTEVARINHFQDEFDIYSYLEHISYANMRSTFPSKSHGRGVLGPRIVLLQQLRKENRITEINPKRPQLNPEKNRSGPLGHLIGKRIHHAADNGVVYGEGVIIDVDNDRGWIIVKFSDNEIRNLGYQRCRDKGFIKLIE